jgi:hypothetical protein
MPHLAPPNPAGFALASLSVAEPARRHLVPMPIFDHLDPARVAANVARSRHQERGNDSVRDIVALTLLSHPIKD